MQRDDPRMRRPPRERPRQRRGDDPLRRLLADADIADNWDVILVGDGSGSNWGVACGWAMTVIERGGDTHVLHGAMSHGTSNVAEIMAPLHALSWLAAREEERRQKHRQPRNAYQVYVVSDSRYVVDTGKAANRLIHKNSLFWLWADNLASKGFVTHFRWLGREASRFIRYADDLSRTSRKYLTAGDLANQVGKRWHEDRDEGD